MLRHQGRDSEQSFAMAIMARPQGGGRFAVFRPFPKPRSIRHAARPRTAIVAIVPRADRSSIKEPS
jgi:hypothetical protein